MKKVIIGILGSSAVYGAAERHFVNSSYCTAILKNGGIPMIIPGMGEEEDRRQLLRLCDGILFPGGDDVDPHLYGEEPHEKSGYLNEAEDLAGIGAMKFADENGLPVLGICKGMQLVNVARGGSLYQDISEFSADHQLHKCSELRGYPLHTVEIDRESRLCGILGTDKLRVNSIHHQCVKQSGRGLRVTARTGDGVPEAMEDETGQILLVQWHPELLTERDPRMNALFSDLIIRAGKRTHGNGSRTIY
ncbi:MAG: gamma-glutamyl-gamma-aminobutyrate hydrolase family protein [Candidatus Limivivens sp.]|nr:gamma-glutamyl-gamma-aminobutyrate hydrolase family protein [Candidatus Limivivens sp.]